MLLEHGPSQVFRAYEIPWKRQEIDFTALATKRWIAKWNVKHLVEYFGCGRTAILKYLGEIRENPELVLHGSTRARVRLKVRRFHGK